MSLSAHASSTSTVSSTEREAVQPVSGERQLLERCRISVVMPAHNEGRLIEAALSAIPAFVDQIIVIDDGSSDATAALAQSYGDPRVELISHGKNRGVGAAITTGYAHAFASGADVAVVMAGDAQMDPADLPALLMPLLRGEAEYVKGDRLSHPEVGTAMPISRLIGNRMLSLLTRLATGLGISDSQCGYTAISRRAHRMLDLDRLWPRYGYPNDLLSHLALSGLVVRDVTIRPVYGEEVSGIGLRDLTLSFPRVLVKIAGRRLLRSPMSRSAR